MTFARILKSNVMLGGAQIATLASAFLRTKIIAIVLGPAGIGLVGVMTAFNGNVSALATWGLGTSGVRLISGAEGDERLRKQAAVRKFGLLLAASGLVLTLALFWPITQVTFHDLSYAPEMLIAGLAVPCLIGSTAWSSLLQARGQVKSLAYLQFGSAVVGLVLGTPLIYLYGTMGVASSMLLAAAVPALATWWIARRDCPPSGAEVMSDDIRALIRLGGGLVFVGLASQVAAYAVRLIIIRHYDSIGSDGLAAAGYYQAAIAIAGSLPAAVFGAMGTDFFPRVAAANNEEEAQYLSEKQIQAGLLLAVPLLTALLTMGGPALKLLYDERFEAAAPLLPWMIWGVFSRLISWPLGYWMLARGSIRLVLLIETSANVMMIILPLIFTPILGLIGASLSYAFSYLFYMIIMLFVSRSRSGKWISSSVITWGILASLWLCLMQIYIAYSGSFWGSLCAVAAASLSCILLYWHCVRGESAKAS